MVAIDFGEKKRGDERWERDKGGVA